MTKAEEFGVLDCTADALSLAVQVLRLRFDEIADLRGVVLDSDDIEVVHDMRVATRRLRSALRDFAPIFRKRPLRKVTKELKKLADSLGSGRDEDVAIAALEKLQAKAEGATVKSGIGKLIDEKRANRERVQFDLTETLAVSAIKDLRGQFDTAIAKARQKKNSAETISFTDAGRDAVLKSLQEFGDLSPNLYAPFRIKELHKLRISTKRLRYAIELFTACWGEQIAPFAQEIAEMQSFLGEIHDADTWIKSLGGRLLENNDEMLQANLWLLSEFVKDRTKNYRGAIELWSKWKANRFVERLRELIL